MLLTIKIKKETHVREQNRLQLWKALDERHQIFWCLGPESNRHRDKAPRDFKSLASTYSATQATKMIFP